MDDPSQDVAEHEDRQPSASLREAVARGIESFIRDHLTNSVFSRDTEAWNHFASKRDALIAAIEREL